MWQRFTSSSVHKVDSKGRVSVPALFRKALEVQGAEGMVVLVPGFRNRACIEGYAPKGFEDIAASIAQMHPADVNRRKLEHRFLGRSMPMQLDDNGRIVLPPALKSAFGIESSAQFVGMGESFQVWAPEAYEAEMAALFEDDDGLDDALALMPWKGAGAVGEGGA